MSSLFPGNTRREKSVFYNLQVIELCTTFDLDDVEKALKGIIQMRKKKKGLERLEYIYIRLKKPYEYTWPTFTEKVSQISENYKQHFANLKIWFYLDTLNM
ncbi:uncharacterized protein LOC113386569 [Ctenocephalides felis]|uniref:uncharacterized protein LOC113386569 n=1 Tax=Ctenocephalides felis TaxID=7515 RepID=UPI000E6E349A|nr:uncharacterized protein LOC113386569 [Ctenocephalides felis]